MDGKAQPIRALAIFPALISLCDVLRYRVKNKLYPAFLKVLLQRDPIAECRDQQ